MDDEHRPISINYTSGTTGRPKGVVYTHRGAYLNALAELVHSRHHPGSVYLWTLPMFHCNGWCTTWAISGIGGTNVCLRAVDAGRDLGPDRPRGRDPSQRRTDRSHLPCQPSGGPAIRAHLHGHHRRCSSQPDDHRPDDRPRSRRRPRLRPHRDLWPLHGVRGTGPTGQAIEDQTVRLLARQGVAYLGADPIRVVDEEMNDVPRDGATMGEVVMRGNNVMAGYYNDPEATARAFRGGWFHSGDLAVWHPDGYIELRDRAKDIIISGGENISTIEIEQAVASHPAVLECAVVAMPHEHWGERPKAFVVLKPGASVRTRRDHRTRPDAARPVQGSRCRRHRRRLCPRLPPARSRSTFCATRFWAGHETDQMTSGSRSILGALNRVRCRRSRREQTNLLP